jgi:hypothetical protein
MFFLSTCQLLAEQMLTNGCFFAITIQADIFNDSAMVLDCLSPAFPKPLRVLILAISSILRALCGVAAGSSKASLSAHFARSNNLGELNAVSIFPPFISHLLASTCLVCACFSRTEFVPKENHPELYQNGTLLSFFFLADTSGYYPFCPKNNRKIRVKKL